MTSIPREPDSLPPGRMARLGGFGMVSQADSYVFRPTNVQEVKDVLALASQAGRQVTLRGAGRSYGDANIGAECLVLDLSRMNQIYSFNKLNGEMDCQAGVTIEQIWRMGLEDGFWPPVVSGTMFPTIGGALAMNIHGKNAFKAGTLGDHILEIDVVLPNGDVRTLKPQSELFHAVISSAGLLGVITRAKLKLKRVKSGDLRVLPISIPNLESHFSTMESLEGDADYMVAWLDCLAKGDKLGRGLFHAAWHSEEDSASPSSFTPGHQDLPDSVLGFFPKAAMWRILKKFNNRPGMKFVNWAKFISSRTLGNGRPHPQSLVGFSFLLDYVPHWRNAYLPGGFIQYQSFVPKEHALAVFKAQLELQQQNKLESYLGVLKRHKTDQFLFSHGVDGYSLALDFKVTKRNRQQLVEMAHQMNEMVLEAGGRFYLAKDSTLRPEDFGRSIGPEALATFRALKAQLDPESILTSSLAQRLKLDPRTHETL